MYMKTLLVNYFYYFPRNVTHWHVYVRVYTLKDVSDIPAGDGKTLNLFLTVYLSFFEEFKSHLYMLVSLYPVFTFICIYKAMKIYLCSESIYCTKEDKAVSPLYYWAPAPPTPPHATFPSPVSKLSLVLKIFLCVAAQAYILTWGWGGGGDQTQKKGRKGCAEIIR
jgi:hypothetical protein